MSENFTFSKDQLWSIPEAISFLRNISLNKDNEVDFFSRHIPIATGPYGGAYKTYIYTFTFSILNFSAEKIIIFTNIALTIILLLALMYGVEKKSIVNFLPILLLPFLDLHFFLGSILDYGPFLLQLIFLSLMIGMLSKITRDESSEVEIKKYLLLSLCFCGFAINDKLTILPNLLAPLIAISIVRAQKIFKVIGLLKFLFFAMIILLISSQPFLYFLIREGTDPMFSMVGSSYAVKTSFFQKLVELAANFLGLSNSSYFFDIMSGESPRSNFSFIKILSGISFLALVLIAIQKYRNFNTEYRLFSFLILTFFLSFFLQAFVQGLNRPWHLFQLYPSLILLSSESIRILNKEKFLRPFIYLGTIFLIALQIQNITPILARVKNTHGINEFSLNIKDCAVQLVQNGISDLYILNYSVGEPLFVYSKGRVLFHDLYWADKSHILDQLKNNYSIQRIAFRTPVQTKVTLGPQLEFLKGPLNDSEKLEHFTPEISCKDEAGSIITIAKRNL